jgi:Na+/melibiose symporter-like transporter
MNSQQRNEANAHHQRAMQQMTDDTKTQRKPLNTYQLASYGAPSMPLSMVALPLAVYLTPVYADSAGFGLSLAFV